MSSSWSGIYCALWTPTDAHGGVLLEPLRAHVGFLRAAGVHGLLALGSTGEFLQLEIAQRRLFFEEIADNTAGMPWIANVSDIRPAAVAELAECARGLNAGAITLLPPYFYPVPQSDLVEFFVRAAESAQLPLMIYNFPERTGNRVALETISAVADRVELAAVKQSGAEFSYHEPLVELGREKGFVVLTGTDTRLGDALKLGVAGCVSGLANAVPELLVEIYSSWKKSALTESLVAQQRMTLLGQLVDQLEFPLNVAAAIEARGFSPGAPKSIVSEPTKSRYQRLVNEIREFLSKSSLPFQ